MRPIRGIERVIVRRPAARIVDCHISRNGVDGATFDSDILSTFENRHGGGHEMVSDKSVGRDVIPR
jgi:hypothetical protein